MDGTLLAQIDTYLPQLEDLIQRGRRLRNSLATEHSSGAALAATRSWQQDCGAVVNQLSGGSKAHWLARSYSEAFLVRSAAGGMVEHAALAEIVERITAVLEQAVTSLSRMRDGTTASASAPALRRFDFVQNGELRPVLEQAYVESRHALDQGQYGEALRICCGILEAIVTDALERKGLKEFSAANLPAGKIVDWPFEMRLAIAEEVGLIRGGWARLSAVARHYRDSRDTGGEYGPNLTVTERDARLTAQVLQVVMRDLNPGR